MGDRPRPRGASSTTSTRFGSARRATPTRSSRATRERTRGCSASTATSSTTRRPSPLPRRSARRGAPGVLQPQAGNVLHVTELTAATTARADTSRPRPSVHEALQLRRHRLVDALLPPVHARRRDRLPARVLARVGRPDRRAPRVGGEPVSLPPHVLSRPLEPRSARARRPRAAEPDRPRRKKRTRATRRFSTGCDRRRLASHVEGGEVPSGRARHEGRRAVLPMTTRRRRRRDVRVARGARRRAVRRCPSRRTRDFDVVVADDGSGPDTAAVVERWGAGVRRAAASRPAGGRGLSARAREEPRRARGNEGDYLVMIDGDCRASPRVRRRHSEERRPRLVRRREAARARPGAEPRACSRSGCPMHALVAARWLRERDAARRSQRSRPATGDVRGARAAGVRAAQRSLRRSCSACGVRRLRARERLRQPIRGLGGGGRRSRGPAAPPRAALRLAGPARDAPPPLARDAEGRAAERRRSWTETHEGSRVEAVSGLRELASELG